MCILATGAEGNRIGFSVTSKKVPLAVNRNRCRRLLSESYRLIEGKVEKGHDIVYIAKRDISHVGMNKILNETTHLYKRSGVLR